MNEESRGVDEGAVGAGLGLTDRMRFHTRWTLEEYDGDVTAEQIARGERLLRRREIDGNILVTAGITRMLELLIGAGGTSFANANAHLGVGDSTTVADISQTDLQAVTNKVRKAVDATYPQVAANVVTFRATFGTGDANFAWEEFAAFNASAAGAMLNRKVSALGTKTSAATWVLTMTLTIQ